MRQDAALQNKQRMEQEQERKKQLKNTLELERDSKLAKFMDRKVHKSQWALRHKRWLTIVALAKFATQLREDYIYRKQVLEMITAENHAATVMQRCATKTLF